MRKLSKRSTAVIAGVAVVVIGGGAAWAATGWSILGTGTASASGAEIKPVTASSTFTKTLFPDRVIPMDTTFTNPNEFAVKLTGAITITHATATPEDNAGTAAACAGALDDPGMFNTTFPGSPTLAAGHDTVASTQVTIGSIPQTCAGKTITIDYSVPGVSAAS
ncbi:hypothetical protein [Actinoplanes palleronii]|uniref:Ribosomally synthesized peptide with SipW-like signal peptide n=1 Tax=Actinoplanes palleronii TaxID=113570 RepID=A0ABQ4B3M2_9ACTN|nr:hypothetical protein [Actinoplanes palleronii]GIE65250.1 hypothetical protein Apa02nite_013580 [Actinoplanes palleronii]